MNQPKPSLQATRDPFSAPHFPFPTAPSIKLALQPLIEQPNYTPALRFHGPLQADLILWKELEYDILVTTSQLLILCRNQELSDLEKGRPLIMTLYCLPNWDWTPGDEKLRYRALISVYDAKNRDAGCTGLVAGPWSPSVYVALQNLRQDLHWKIRTVSHPGTRAELAGREWVFWPLYGHGDPSSPELSLFRHANFEFVATDEEILEAVGFDDRRSFVWPCQLDEGQAGGVKKEEVPADVIKKEEEVLADVIKKEEAQAGNIKQEETQAGEIKQEEGQFRGIKKEEGQADGINKEEGQVGDIKHEDLQAGDIKQEE